MLHITRLNLMIDHLNLGNPYPLYVTTFTLEPGARYFVVLHADYNGGLSKPLVATYTVRRNKVESISSLCSAWTAQHLPRELRKRLYQLAVWFHVNAVTKAVAEPEEVDKAWKMAKNRSAKVLKDQRKKAIKTYYEAPNPLSLFSECLLEVVNERDSREFADRLW